MKINIRTPAAMKLSALLAGVEDADLRDLGTHLKRAEIIRDRTLTVDDLDAVIRLVEGTDDLDADAVVVVWRAGRIALPKLRAMRDALRPSDNPPETTVKK